MAGRPAREQQDRAEDPGTDPHEGVRLISDKDTEVIGCGKHGLFNGVREHRDVSSQKSKS